MIIRTFINFDEPLTEEEKEELRALKNRPIVFDEDCPELTDEQLKQFKRVNTLPQQKAVSV